MEQLNQHIEDHERAKSEEKKKDKAAKEVLLFYRLMGYGSSEFCNILSCASRQFIRRLQ